MFAVKCAKSSSVADDDDDDDDDNASTDAVDASIAAFTTNFAAAEYNLPLLLGKTTELAFVEHVLAVEDSSCCSCCCFCMFERSKFSCFFKLNEITYFPDAYRYS